MDNSQIEINDLLIGQAISADSFGIFYSAHHKKLNQPCLAYGLVSLPERPITQARLTQALNHVTMIEHNSLAQTMSFQACDPSLGKSLSELAVEQGVIQNFSSPIEFVVIYDIDSKQNLSAYHRLTEPEVKQMGEGLLELLSLLHKKRAYHHALSPKTLWVSDNGIKLTHSGLYSVYKRRGLSLKSTPNPDLDPALSHRHIYASPEELLGKLSTQSSDLFSVAAILYEHLVESLKEPKIDSGEYERELKTGDLPAEWQSFFRKAMATQIRDRYPTADQMLKAFRALPILNADYVVEKTAEVLQKVSEEMSDIDLLESTDVITPQLLSELEEMSDQLDQTHSELDQDDGSAFDLNSQTELSAPNPDMTEQEPEQEQTSSLFGQSDNQESNKGALPQDSVEEENKNNEALPSEGLEEIEPVLNQSSNAQSNFAQTVGFFSGGEVGSEGFKSLRSQLSPEKTLQSVEQPPKTETENTAGSYDEMAFGPGSNLDLDNDLGFGLSQQDERTFIEFSDIDDQTIFEADQDQIVRESYKTQVGSALEIDPVSNQVVQSSPQPPKAQTLAFFSQENNSSELDIQLQTPDFLTDNGDEDPSRILPIPRSNKKTASAIPSKAQVIQDVPPPLDQARNLNPPSLEKPVAVNVNRSKETVQQALGLKKSSIVGNAQDWPGQNEAQSLYTPPTPTGVINRDSRPVAKVKKGQSWGKRIVALVIPLVLVSSGSIGVYWVNTNWDLVMGLLASEAPERLSISTYPNDMQVVINNKPVKDRSPLIYNFQTNYSEKYKLPVRFMWKRKIHNEQIQLSNGTTSVYFLAEKMKRKTKKSRYRRRFSKKVVKFSKAYIDTPGESLQVLLEDQPIGQTPLWIIAEHGKELSLKLIGPGIEKEVKISPDNTMTSQISIPIPPRTKE